MVATIVLDWLSQEDLKVKVDPRLVIQFSVVAEEASFTKAAARFRVAQPWLSTRVRQLEEALGFTLLVRSTRSVALTERGSEFLKAARLLEAASGAVDILAAQLRRGDPRRLRIGVPPYSGKIAQRRDLIDQFAANYRDVSIELDIGWSPSLHERVRSGDLDMAFTMGEFENSGLDKLVLCRMGVGLMMSCEHALCAVPHLRAEHLVGYPVEVFTRGLNPGLFDALYAPLIAAGVHLVQMPEMADTLPDYMDPDQPIAAFFEFGFQPPHNGRVTQRVLQAEAVAPFGLIKRSGVETPLSRAFWDIALHSVNAER